MPSYPSIADASLTAAEALILLEPNKAQGKTALKLTLLELLAQRLLTVHRQDRAGVWGIPRNVDLLQCAPGASEPVSMRSHVRNVLHVLRIAGASRGIPMKQVVTAIREEFGTNLSGFQTRHLVPELVARGLLAAYQRQIFRVFRRTRYRCTPSGEAARSQLEGQLAQARVLPALLDTDPAQAAAVVITLGSTVLLVEELRSHYAKLAQALGMYRVNSASAIEFDFDFEAWGAVDSGWEASDAGFDTGDGDGGGNGGNEGGGE